MIPQRIATFEKVSFEQFRKDYLDQVMQQNAPCQSEIVTEYIRHMYDNIKMPQRATAESAGYDFYLPFDIKIPVGGVVTIPTGIRCNMDMGWKLDLLPRSGHGFKYGIRLINTIGLIDSDYYDAENEGHIMVRLINDSSVAKEFCLSVGSSFCQGVFQAFGITRDDQAAGARTGGFGSTDQTSKQQ